MRVTVPSDQLHAGFMSVRESSAFSESAALVAQGKRPVEMLQAMALRPEILRAFAATSEAIYPGGIVDRRIKELIILEASRHNRCQFCTASHISIAKMLGITDAAGEPLGLLDDASRLSDRERLAVEYTRAAQRDSNRIPNELFDAMRSVYSDAEIVELTAMIGLITMLNMFNNCLQITYHGEYEAS
jgi:AhpD family alkylhydroperoxidase